MAVTQRYVSKELTHFVGKGNPEEQQYLLLVKILASGWLTHVPHEPKITSRLTINVGGGKLSENDMYSPEVVCFCDIPVGDLEIHKIKYGRFAISFLKPFLICRGANPVFYVAKNSKVWTVSRDNLFKDSVEPMPVGPGVFTDGIRRAVYFDKMVSEYQNLFLFKLPKALRKKQKKPGILPPVPALDPLHHFLDFYVLSFIQFFDDSTADDDPKNYYMEREWRMLGNLNFELADVRRVILPEEFTARLRADVPGYVGQVTFVD